MISEEVSASNPAVNAKDNHNSFIRCSQKLPVAYEETRCLFPEAILESRKSLDCIIIRRNELLETVMMSSSEKHIYTRAHNLC